ncbi:DUF397 domain-containing protein [Micromonospora chersina]|nr:DUF397 domain-containing protein [Micromonospora chersina]
MLQLIRFHAAPDWFRPWEEIEREATSLRWYGPTAIPGLLQTEAYARAMLADRGSGDDMDLSRAAWRKASRSNANGGACVEVADNLPGVVAVRDSKDPSGPVLTFDPASWRAFVVATPTFR